MSRRRPTGQLRTTKFFSILTLNFTSSRPSVWTSEGASKPTYDIWGDTVNVASRLESSGILGRIQVSEQVAQLLERHGQFELDCRGPIEVKGKGRLTTYLVVTPFDCTETNPSTPQDGLEMGLDEGQEPEPPPTLEADDEVEELCADEPEH